MFKPSSRQLKSKPVKVSHWLSSSWATKQDNIHMAEIWSSGKSSLLEISERSFLLTGNVGTTTVPCSICNVYDYQLLAKPGTNICWKFNFSIAVGIHPVQMMAKHSHRFPEFIIPLRMLLLISRTYFQTPFFVHQVLLMWYCRPPPWHTLPWLSCRYQFILFEVTEASETLIVGLFGTSCDATWPSCIDDHWCNNFLCLNNIWKIHVKDLTPLPFS